MSFHLTCYEKMTGKSAKGAIARYESTCDVCASPIMVGSPFTWTRNANDNHTPTPTPTPNDPSSLINLDALAEALIPRLENRLAASNEIQRHTLEITINEIPRVEIAQQHRSFPTLLRACAARVNVWLSGPSGSGKTTAAQSVASTLELPFYFLGALEDPFSIFGYTDAQGKLVRTPAREAYENGGVLLFDEVDSYSPSATVALNAMLGNGHASFPDGVIERHPDCIIIGGANTVGLGASKDYVGRNRLDAAFLKRFVFLAWDYDTDLELATAPNPTWTKRVQEIRAKVLAKGLRVLVTPRESYTGARLLAAGIDQYMVEDMTIFAGMTPDQIAQIR